MPFDEAAGFPIAYGTSHLALDWKAALQPGEMLFVTGAAGGVGLTAVEIGKRMGARVIASARGADRLQVAKAAGAANVHASIEAALAQGGFDRAHVLVPPDIHARAAEPFLKAGIPVLLVDEATDVGAHEHEQLMARAGAR
jgi:NADPH:quinone reductase-like Zn-dependent oxidoreductase